MTTRNFKNRLAEYFRDIKINWCKTTISKLYYKKQVVTDLKKNKEQINKLQKI